MAEDKLYWHIGIHIDGAAASHIRAHAEIEKPTFAELTQKTESTDIPYILRIRQDYTEYPMNAAMEELYNIPYPIQVLGISKDGSETYVSLYENESFKKQLLQKHDA